jgi:uncharacterized oligopeptide transporter (OPT) family protein
MDLAHGLLMGVFGCLATFVGFFIAFLVVNHNIKLEQRRNVKDTGPMSDLNKSIYGEDCQ